MKSYTFTIGGRTVTVEAVQALGRDGKPISAVDFTATCEDKTKNDRMAMHPKENKTKAQLEKNMEDEARKVATSLAGTMQSESLLGDIFK